MAGRYLPKRDMLIDFGGGTDLQPMKPLKDVHRQILTKIEHLLREAPDQRFGQALFNLDINQFKNPNNPDQENHLLRDIYNDNDEDILKRMRDIV